jgi:drug/metabolite transporter (DMT)-like permease
MLHFAAVPGTLFALILLAAVLHAGWNFFAKRSGGSVTVLWLGASASTLLTIPLAVARQWSQPFPWDGFAVACLSGVVHCAYWWGLGRMYRHGAISLTYPIARGSGVMGTALGSVLFLREPLSATGMGGIVLVCTGVFALGFQRAHQPVRARAVALALLTGLTITGYSLIDDRGVELIDPVVYLATETAVGALLLAVLGWRRVRGRVRSTYRAHRATIWVIGVGSPLAYLIVLLAYARGPVGYITAVRESSVVIAAFLGVRLLGERLSPVRRWGVALVLAGLVLIKWA